MATNQSTTKTKRTTVPKSATAEKPPAPKPEIPCYNFPAIVGIQSDRTYYSAMIPLYILPKLFITETEDMPAETRAQRRPNQKRIKDIAKYVLEKNYVLGSVTVTVDTGISDMTFDKVQGTLGTLKIPQDSKLLIADGQHRIFGLQMAMQQNPELKHETINCVIYLDTGLKRRQQIFHDLNYFASKPNKSINLLYDHESEKSEIARKVLRGVPIFAQYTDTEQTSLGTKSCKVFTFNAIEEANQYLLTNFRGSTDEKISIAIDFWKIITNHIPEWERLLSKDYAPSEIRTNLICGHAIALNAIAHLGFYLLRHENWKQKLEKVNIKTVNWTKTNPEFNEMIIFGGRIHKNISTIRAFSEWLWKREMLNQEVVQAKIKDWMLSHFAYQEDTEILAQLEGDPRNNKSAQQCFTELDLHCNDSIFYIAWSTITSSKDAWPGNLHKK